MATHKNIQDFIANTDFKQMRKQKRILLKVIAGKPLTVKEKDEMDGVLSFYDNFQDMCVDSYGETSKKVFGRKS